MALSIIYGGQAFFTFFIRVQITQQHFYSPPIDRRLHFIQFFSALC